MRFYPYALAILAFVLAVPVSAQLPWLDSSSSGEREYVANAYRGSEEMMKEWRLAWEEQDARALAEMYTLDAVLVLPDGTMIRGRDEIEQAFRERLSTLGTMQSGIVDFVVGGSVAHALSWFEHLSPQTGDGV